MLKAPLRYLSPYLLHSVMQYALQTHFKGGAIVIGEQSIIYHNGETFSSLAMKPTIMKAYGLIDSTGERILLGDHLGRLYVLILEQNNQKQVTGMKLELIGQVHICSFLFLTFRRATLQHCPIYTKEWYLLDLLSEIQN